MAFNEANVERKFKSLNNTQDSIQSISLWVIHHKAHYEKIIESWFKILKKSPMPHRLTMFYLCNDVVQTCKRKHAIVYKDAFKDILKDAVLLVRDSTIRPNIERMFKIWDERNIYDSEYMEDLIGVLENQKVRTVMNSRLLAEFQPAKVVEELHTYSKLLADVEKKHKVLPQLKMDSATLENIRQLKDKSHGKEYTQQFEDSCVKLEEYINLLETALKQRTSLIELLEQSELFYDSQFGEARIVANAYKNFGTRVNNLKKKLDDLKDTLPSPVTTPTMDAPSPGNTPPLDDTHAVDMEMSDDEKDAKKDSDSPKSLGSAPSPEGSPIGLSPQRGAKLDAVKPGGSEMPFTSFMTSSGGGSTGFMASHSTSNSGGDDLSNTRSDIMNTLKDLSRFEELWNQGALKLDTPPQDREASPGKDRSPQPIPTLSSSRADFSPLGDDDSTPIADEMGAELQSSQDSDEEGGDVVDDDGGGGTPVMDEMGKDIQEQPSVSSILPDHNAMKTNPIDFLNQLISQSSKAQPKTTANNLLHSLSVLSRANLDESDSDSGRSTPNSWASWKAMQHAPPQQQQLQTQQQPPASHHMPAPPPPPPHAVNTSLHQAHPPNLQAPIQVSPPVMAPVVQSGAHQPAFPGSLPPPVQPLSHAPPPPPPPPIHVQSEHNSMPAHLSMPPHFSQSPHSQPPPAAAPQTPVQHASLSTPDTAPHMHQTQPTSAAGHSQGVLPPHHAPPLRNDALQHMIQTQPPPNNHNQGPLPVPHALPLMTPQHRPPPPVSKPPPPRPPHPPSTSMRSPPPGYQSAYSTIPPPPRPPQPPRFTPASVRPQWPGPPPPPPPSTDSWQRQPAPTPPRWMQSPSQPPPRNPSPGQWQSSPPAQSPPPRNTSPNQWQPIPISPNSSQPSQSPQPWKMTISSQPRPPRPPLSTPPIKINRNSNLTELSSHGQSSGRPNLTELSQTPQRSNLSEVPASRPPMHKNANLSNLTELSLPQVHEKPRPAPLDVHVTPVNDDLRAKTAVRRGNLTPIQMVDLSQPDMDLDSEEEEGEITSDSDKSPVKAPVDIQSPDQTPRGSVSPQQPPPRGSVSPQQPHRPSSSGGVPCIPSGSPSTAVAGSKRPSQDDQLEFIEKLKRKSATTANLSDASPGNGPASVTAGSTDGKGAGDTKAAGGISSSSSPSVTTPSVDATSKPSSDSDGKAKDSPSESRDASQMKAKPAHLDWSAPAKPVKHSEGEPPSNIGGYYSDSPYKRREVDSGDPYRREWPSDYAYVPAPRNRHHSSDSSPRSPRHSHADAPSRMSGPPQRPPGPPPFQRNKPYHGHHSPGSHPHRRYNRY